MLKIWGRPDSICTQRVLWTCAELGLDFELILSSATMGPNGHVSTGADPHGVVDTPWYRARNPNGTVPTIEDEDFVLWESNAIVAYLAARHGEQTLYGRSHQVFGQATAWMAWTNQYMEPVLHTLVMELVRLRADLRTPGEAERAAGSLAPALLILDAQLADWDYITGEHFTMGDIPAGAAFYRWKLFDMGGPATPNADRWLSRLAERDGFREHVEPRHKHLG